MFFIRSLLQSVALICLLMMTVPANATSGELGWDKRVVHGTLGNGFRYYLFDSRQEKDAKQGLSLANLMVFSGANDEQPEQLGVAHMVEHMVFHESDGLPQGVRKAFTGLGLRQGRDFNAMTTSENTRYMVSLQSTTQEQLTKVLGIYQQIAFHANIKPSSLAKERLIIEEEWRGKLNHRTRINAEKKALLHTGALYPYRPVIGTQKSIQMTPASKLRRFYHDWYVPNNMALIIYAPVDPHVLESHIKKVFGHATKQPLPIRHSQDPVLDSSLKIGELNDPGSKINRVAFLYRFQSEKVNSAEGRRDGLINYMTRRLLSQQIKRQSDVLPDHVRSLFSTKGSLSPNVDIVGFSVNVDAGYFDLGAQTLAAELTRLKQHGFYQEDFDQVYQRVNRVAERNKKAAKSRGSIWSVKMVDAVVKGEPLTDPVESNNQIVQEVKSITLADVNARLREWLSAPDRIVYTQAVAGKSVDLGSASVIEGLFSDANAQSLPALQTDKVVEKKQLPVVKAKGSVTLQSRDEQLGLSSWLLENGDQLTILNPQHFLDKHTALPHPQKMEDIDQSKSFFTAISDAGYQVASGSVWAEQIALQMSEATGIYGWSDESFQQWRKDNKVALSAKQTASRLTYRGSIKNDKLATLLGAYRINQVNPKISDTVYRDVMAGLKRKAGGAALRPAERFSMALAQARFGEEETLRPTLPILESFSHDMLERTRQAQVALPVHYLIVSRLSDSTLVDLASEYLATIPRHALLDKAKAANGHNYVTEPLTQKPGHYTLDMAINSEPKSDYRLYAYQAMPWSPVTAVQLTYLGEHIEESLKHRLRSEVQGVYSVRVGLDFNKETHRAELSIYYSASPARLDDLAKLTEETLANLPELISPQWVARVQKEFRRVEVQRLQNGFASTLSHRLELSDTLYGDARYLNSMGELESGLTFDRLRDLAQQLTFSNRVLGLLRPREQ